MDYKPAIRQMIAELSAEVHIAPPGDDVELFTYFPQEDLSGPSPWRNPAWIGNPGDQFVIPPWGPDQEVSPPGGLSIFGLRLVNAIEQTLGVAFDAEDMHLDNFRSINAIDAFVRRKVG